MNERVFRHVTPDEFRWQTDVSGAPERFTELLWIDGHLDGGWKLGFGLFRAWPRYDGRPCIYICLLSPDGTCRRIEQAFDPDEFRAGENLDAHLGKDNWISTRVGAIGDIVGYDFVVSVDGLQFEGHCDTVCTGVKFSSQSPGYTSRDSGAGIAVGWWPLIPSARASCRIVIDGATIETSGVFYLERQISSFPLGGLEGEKSAQSIWTWGNFHAGDFTAGWTDSGASEHFGYRHFTPFVLWKNSEPFLSTFSFASYVEKFKVNPDNGLVYPEVVTLKASNGEIDFFARMTNGRMIEHNELDRKRDSIYCRQACDVHGTIWQWGKPQRIVGEAIHEWGTQAGNYPFIRTAA